MKVSKYSLLKTGTGFNKIRERIHKPIGKNMKFGLVILGLMYFPVFLSMASSNQNFGGSDTLFSFRGMRQNNFDLSIQKSKTLFNGIEHKVIGIDLGTKNVCTVVGYSTGVFSLIENNLSEKYHTALIIAPNAPENIFNVRKTGYNSSKIKSDKLVAELIRNESILASISEFFKASKVRITPVRATIMEYAAGPSVLQSVPGYEYLTQCKLKGCKVIIPIQDMMTPINTKNPSEYNKKQIFGIAVQAKQYIAAEYSANKDYFKKIGGKIDLNFTFNDQVPEENQKIISAIYAQIYANEFNVDLSKINVSYIKESDAAITTYLYENYNATLKKITNRDKIVVLNLGQSGFVMKGLVGTDQEIQVTKSKAFNDISGDLIDEAIWNIFKKKVAQEIGESKDIELTYEDAKNLVETNLYLKSKCLVEQKKIKEKLSASGADIINVSIDSVYGDEDVEFMFSVKDINAALENLIKTFQNDIYTGVQEIFDQNGMADIEFVIVGGSLRIPCLLNELQGFTSVNLNKTLNMDEAPAYGAAYTSLLENEYKNALSKTVATKQVEQILQYIGFNYYYKPILNRLFIACTQQTELKRLRNEIEKACYIVQHIAAENKNSRPWEDLNSSSYGILNNTLKVNPLKDNLEFITILHNRFNHDTIEQYESQPDALKQDLDRIEVDFRDSVDLRLSAIKSYNAKYQGTELGELLEDLVEDKSDDLKVLNGTLAGNYFKVCLNLFLEKLNEVNPNFSSFDIFEIILQLREGKAFDPAIAVDVWLSAKLYFSNIDTNH